MTADPSGVQEPEEGRFNFSQGQSVRIVDGPFIQFVGKVIESCRERKKVTVLISYFGKETPFLFDFRQVEKIEPFFI
jgi:transcription termination/antitermination protein NusG